MKVVIITQARHSSSRLPGKVLLNINGKSILQLHLERIRFSKLATDFFVAIAEETGSKIIETISTKAGFQSYIGSVKDVLDRFYQTSKIANPDLIVRLTSDCPLIDHNLIDEMIDFMLKNPCDYLSNTLNPTYPDGQDIEIFTIRALQEAWLNAKVDSEREHVTPYIWKNSNFFSNNLFKSFSYENGDNYSHIRMTVDEFEDFQLVEKLTSILGFDKSWKEYSNYIIKNNIGQLNSQFSRNSGYLKSTNDDK